MPALFAWDCAQLRKPPSNQPQVTPFALSRSPMFRLFGSIEVLTSRVSQMSPAGCGSPIIVVFVVTAMPNDVASGEKPCVCPDMRLTAPTVDGPKFVSYELSDIAKDCA